MNTKACRIENAISHELLLEVTFRSDARKAVGKFLHDGEQAGVGLKVRMRGEASSPSFDGGRQPPGPFRAQIAVAGKSTLTCCVLSIFHLLVSTRSSMGSEKAGDFTAKSGPIDADSLAC